MVFQVPRNHLSAQGQNLGDPDINIETKESFQMQLLSSAYRSNHQGDQEGRVRKPGENSRMPVFFHCLSPSRAALAIFDPCTAFRGAGVALCTLVRECLAGHL